MGCDIAACAAVGAYRVYFSLAAPSALPCPELAGKRAGRAYTYTLAAEFAFEVFFITGAYFRVEPAVTEVDRLDTLDLITDFYASAAHDALFEIALHKRIAVTLCIYPSFALIPVLPDAIVIGKVLKRAAARLLADHAVIRMVGENKLKYGLS